MDLPKAPQDIELRNIIDKLAQFVARNGPEFEQMTKNKQKGNPKFGFLFGGEYFNYYQYKVTTEQARIHQQQQQQPPQNLSLNSPQGQVNFVAQWLVQQQQQQQNVGPAMGSFMPPLTVEAITQQQQALHEQTTQSEQNLNAQHMVLMQQQEAQVEEAIRKREVDIVNREADELGVNLKDFDAILQPIIDSCTKDSISTGKAWILQRATSKSINDLLTRYLLYKVLEPDRKFSHKLHLIYLVNDILHHCVRKHIEDFKLALEQVVIPMFCNASLSVTDEQQMKLSKLLTIWESKNHYFNEEIVSQLKDPTNSWAKYKQQRLTDNAEIVEAIASQTKVALTTFQSQHLAFISHAHRQIQTLEQQKQQLEAQKQQEAVAAAINSQDFKVDEFNTTAANVLPPLPAQESERELMNPQPPQPPSSQPPPFDIVININQPPPGFHFPPQPSAGDIELPDLTRPPPGFPPVQPEIQPEDLLPSLPYYDLPAGLMVPLIKLEDFNYKPLDPDAIRLPPPVPPSDRLLAAVKAFYSPPGHEQPRDGSNQSRTICRGENVDCDGWEKLGLYEYFRAKAAAKKQKELDIESGHRQPSRSPSPVKSFQENARTPPPKKRYSSRSRSKERERTKPRRSRRERSRSPHQRNERNDENTPVRDNRSPTPPSFLGIGSYQAPVLEDRLSEANKGHQMLKKMGWSGAGLGVKEQGIEQPISGGDVRDRSDQYKGVGVNLNDPYENFRKSKGKAFITRMKARAEERS
ncbi:calcium homeostasis endoplasmic reticulum protein isoform X2 [Cimex lectularius]|uniref:Calcium homeostasis endoplasmic reticulum protein n=1 Tax=Cimex lectularius TaxID=79782 RepID=A0A8I6SAW1_CIMLE|nr:calcium homeostasis endoplasmic reticulum protein isoform X2 [Cimex lectularius]